METIGLYIHIPFCLRKCAYCDFVSFSGCEPLFDRYIDALIDEAKLYKPMLKDHLIDSVFIGGGTPSLLSAAQMKRLTGGLQDVYVWQNAEVTVEANPETLTDKKLEAYAACGINRLSMGLQTHDDHVLGDIGRQHTWQTFLSAYENAVRYFANINADVIFGLPGQTLPSFLETVNRLIALGLKHVSAYALKLEAGTPLAARYAGTDEETDRAMYHGAVSLLEQAGFMHYETSNFARNGYVCHHNLKYWTGGAYLGLGVAAHSYFPAVRFCNTKSLDGYLELVASGQKPVADQTSVTQEDKLTEYLMLRLRLKSGIEFCEYEKKFGRCFKDDYNDAINVTKRAGLITVDGGGIRPTLKGFDLQNALIGEFIKNI